MKRKNRKTEVVAPGDIIGENKAPDLGGRGGMTVTVKVFEQPYERPPEKDGLQTRHTKKERVLEILREIGEPARGRTPAKLMKAYQKACERKREDAASLRTILRCRKKLVSE
jgi:hypothetical protein